MGAGLLLIMKCLDISVLGVDLRSDDPTCSACWNVRKQHCSEQALNAVGTGRKSGLGFSENLDGKSVRSMKNRGIVTRVIDA